MSLVRGCAGFHPPPTAPLPKVAGLWNNPKALERSSEQKVRVLQGEEIKEREWGETKEGNQTNLALQLNLLLHIKELLLLLPDSLLLRRRREKTGPLGQL